MPQLSRPIYVLGLMLGASWGFISTAWSDEAVYPDREWEMATPESQSVDSDALTAAIQYLEAHTGANGVKRMVVVRNGRMIWRGDEADVEQGVWSITKAFTSTAHGLLIEDGKCTLDTLAKDFDPALAELYPTVTLRHLATMTSGIDGVGGAYDEDEQGRNDANALVTPQTPFFPPGTKFMYWDEATQHYGYALTQIAGEPLYDYLKRRVLDPVGITRFTWYPDATNKVPNWTGGSAISASDLARFGLLYLNHGRWRDRQLISADWVTEATRIQVPPTIPDALPKSSRKGSGVYGYHWWPNGRTPGGKYRWPHAPLGTYSRSGYNNNDLFVMPAWNMVVVRLGLDELEDNLTTDEYDEFLKMLATAILDPVVETSGRLWYPTTVSFRGPRAKATDDHPNPFADFRLQVRFASPSGREWIVPGFFAGDGFAGGQGTVWRAKFSPDEPGRWTFQASFRTGSDVAVSLAPEAGEPTAFDGQTGSFEITDANSQPGDPRRRGRLGYVGGHYLKFRDGPYWIRGGTDSPENFLAYAGFDNTPPSHLFADHVEDWRPGDPDWGSSRGRGIIGALNYLGSKHVNSIYFLTMNVGGDGCDVWPWLHVVDPKGSPENDHRHFDIGKLRQWETVFDHAQQQGIFLHFVFNEAEKLNKRELDQGELGPDRKLYYRELVARFAHHLALQWNLCEEYNLDFDLGPDRVRSFADYVRAVDPYDHPVTVHSAGDPLEALRFTFGDERFSITSIQLGQSRIDSLTEQLRDATAAAGRPLPVSMDEFTLDKGQSQGWVPVDDAERWRKEKLWPTLLSGGNIEFILGDLLKTDSFKTPQRDQLWDYVWYARSFVEQLPFWEMQPADQLLSGAASITVTQNRGRSQYPLGAQVFAAPGRVYAIYLPTAAQGGQLDLTAAAGEVTIQWYDPRTGTMAGSAATARGGPSVSLGSPPLDAEQDWVVLVKRKE